LQTNKFIIEALLELYPTGQFSIGDDFESLEWMSEDIQKPTYDDIKDLATQKENEYNSKLYSVLRKQEYDKLNKFDMQFNDAMNGTTTWIDAINEIKAKYPKV